MEKDTARKKCTVPKGNVNARKRAATRKKLEKDITSEEALLELNLMSDFLFSAVMEDKEACEYLISKLLGKKVMVVDNKTQFSIRSIDKHSIVYDILVRDENGVLYDVEINTDDGGDHEKRVRYYISSIDQYFLNKGAEYKELPELYLLYITKKDPFKLNKNHYEVVQSIKGTRTKYNNGVHIHYFNLEAKDPKNPELTELLEYFEHSDLNDMRFGALSKAVNFHKDIKKGGKKMCKVIEDYAWQQAQKYGEEQRSKGKLEEKLEIIKEMLNDGMALEKALKYAKLDARTYEKYKAEQ